MRIAERSKSGIRNQINYKKKKEEILTLAANLFETLVFSAIRGGRIGIRHWHGGDLGLCALKPPTGDGSRTERERERDRRRNGKSDQAAKTETVSSIWMNKLKSKEEEERKSKFMVPLLFTESWREHDDDVLNGAKGWRS